jgi:predicted DsbA family dithiol-disulfide isomerase
MAEKVRFHFDPRCPWCYQTSRWAKDLERLGEIEIEWAHFSLVIANLKEGETVDGIDPSTQYAQRTAQVIQDALGRNALGPFWTALGKRLWHTVPPADETTMADAVRESLQEAGMDPGFLDKAMADESTWQAVIDEHNAVVERFGAFGVPTIVLDGGEGPAIFGPVIYEPPPDDEAVELWQHTTWLVRNENVAELKRNRTKVPDLEAMAWRMEQRRLQQERDAAKT